MKKSISCLLFSLGMVVPSTVIASSCCLNNQQECASLQNYSLNKPTIKKLEAKKLFEKRSKVIRCLGLGENHFADICFYYFRGKQTLRIITYQNYPHVYFRDDDPYVTLKITSQDDKTILDWKVIGDKVLPNQEKVIELKDGYKIEFMHKEGRAFAQLWDAQRSNNKFQLQNLIGKSDNFSFLVSNDVDTWRNHEFGVVNQYNGVFSDFEFIFLQKSFDLTFFDKVTKKKIATLFTSSSNGGCMYLLSSKKSFGKERKLSYQDTSGNKYHFTFKQGNYYVIENLAECQIDFNFSNIDDFEFRCDQVDRAKYLLEIANQSWYYLTDNDIRNTKDRQKYVLTDQDHVLMQYAFKRIVNDNLFLKKNLLSFKYRCFYRWILNSKEALFYYLTAGHAQLKKINYTDAYTFWMDIDNSSDAEWRAFEIWYDIWRNYPEASSGKYLKLSIAIALELASGIDCWISDEGENTSPLKRYELFVWLDSQEIYKSRPLENNSVQELRNIVGFKTGNEDLKWLYEYICKILDKKLDYDFISSGHRLIDYASHSIYSEIFSENTFYGHGRMAIYRLVKYSGVSGAVEKISAIIANLFGLPAMTVGQSNHCIYLCHNDHAVGYKTRSYAFCLEKNSDYRTWIQWMLADDQMHYSSKYFYDEFYAISNFIDGSLARDQKETNKQKVIKNFHTLLEKNNKQICISQTSQWGWVKRSQIFKHFAKYDYLREEINSLKEEAIQKIRNVFQKYEKNRNIILEYYV